ncbi:MAG: pilus assembly protein [bacterium]|nr:pilus assembly protein [bacterium]
MSKLKKLANEQGSVAVEFAFVLPILIILIAGAIEFGFALCNQQVLTNACREGARAGIVAKSPRVSKEDIENIVNNYLSNHLVSPGKDKKDNIVPRIEIEYSSQNPGDDLSVEVSYQYNFLLMNSFIPKLPKSLTLTAQSVMKYE